MRILYFHEIRQGFRMLLIWSLAVAVLIMLCMIIFPDMAQQSESVDEMFAGMGGFTDAFGMNVLSLSDPLGYYGIQAGAILGLGGALFAALLGARMLSKEEVEHTAEFLLTHPLSRASVISAKLAALVSLIVIFNIICLVFGIASFAMIGEELGGNAFWLFHLAQVLMHLEIACICFGFSALLKRGSLGFGLGLAGILYFINIFANLSEDWNFLRFITPFGYADAAQVIPDASINSEVLFVGMVYLVLGVLLAYIVYSRKDIAS